jgi:sugar phosphate isomerase/epimerase
MIRLSLNQITVNRLSLRDAVGACRESGIPSIAVWREKVAEIGLPEAARILEDSGLFVSSLCRGGFFTDADATSENRRAVEEAAGLGAEVLVLVCGGLPVGSRDLAGARARVAAGIEELAPYAIELGVRLGIEPLHPMYCSDRSVVSTLGQALDLAAPFPAENVGVIVDAYHVWWDPTLEETLARAAGRIAGFHIDDWVVPLPAGVLLGRGLPGEGVIDLPRLAASVFAAGFDGPVEVEVLNERVWEAAPAATLAAIVRSAESLFVQTNSTRGPRSQEGVSR